MIKMPTIQNESKRNGKCEWKKPDLPDFIKEYLLYEFLYRILWWQESHKIKIDTIGVSVCYGNIWLLWKMHSIQVKRSCKKFLDFMSVLLLFSSRTDKASIRYKDFRKAWKGVECVQFSYLRFFKHCPWTFLMSGIFLPHCMLEKNQRCK